MDISLGDRVETQSSNTYPYRGIIECLLNYGKDTLQTQFGYGLFCMDTAGHMEDVTAGGDNKGLIKRMRYTEGGRIIELISPIHFDLFFQDKLLINEVDLKLKFIRAKNEFCLMRNTVEDFKLHIVSASLFIKMVTVFMLMHSNVKCPIDRVCVKNFSIPTGSRVCNQVNIFLGQIPKFRNFQIAIYINKHRVGSFFDSFGNPPTYGHFPKSISAFLNRNCESVQHSVKQVQDMCRVWPTLNFFSLPYGQRIILSRSNDEI